MHSPPPTSQQLLQNGPHVSKMTQKCLVIYKLLLLENARSALDQELLNITNKVNEEVQSFLNSPFSTSQYCDLVKALDAKCQVVDKVVALLQDITNEPQFCVKASAENGVITNRLNLLRDKGIFMSDVLKFGPMLQNVLMASSITKAVQVLGATLSLQQLKQFLISKPKAVESDVLFCSIKSSHITVVETTSSICHLKAKEKGDVMEKPQTDAMVEPPAIIQKDITERPPLPPPNKLIFPTITNPHPVKKLMDAPLIGWGFENDVQVRHQKQTSAQLLKFLRRNAKNQSAMEVTFMEWGNNFQYPASLTQPTMKINKRQIRDEVANNLRSIDALALKNNLLGEMENQAPVFKVKRVESSGFLTYTCLIASKTELWDIGDVFTEARQDPSIASPLEKEIDEQSQKGKCNVDTSTKSLHFETQSLQGPEPQDSSAVAASLINHVGIPEFQIRKFEEMEVVVSHIVSPGNFYIQHPDAIMKQQALVKDSWKASSSFAEQNCIPDIRTHVMGFFPKQKQWCRAQVIKICGMSGDNNANDGAGRDIKVEVKRLDHGDTACLSLWNVKYLTPDMTVLPLQAAQVSLANVTPVDGRDWSEEAVDWFRAMVDNRTLYARLYPEGPKLTVELFLEKGKMGAMRRGAPLSVRLAQNGHAKHYKVKNGGKIKGSTFQLQMRKQESAWEKYLISCYTQSRK